MSRFAVRDFPAPGLNIRPAGPGPLSAVCRQAATAVDGQASVPVPEG